MGCRRVEYDRRSVRSWRKCSRVFAWVSPSAKRWRQRVGQVAAAVAVTDYNGLKRKLGRKWAYELRKIITATDEKDWKDFVEYLNKNRRKNNPF